MNRFDYVRASSVGEAAALCGKIGSAFLAALIVSFVSWLLNLSLGNRSVPRVVMVRQQPRRSRSSREVPSSDANGAIDLHQDDSGEWK